MIHELKTWPEYFNMIAIGLKTFEVRKDDRGFELGDTLVLKEYLPDDKKFTGNEIRVHVVHIMRSDDVLGGLVPGFVVMGFEVLARYIVR